MIKRNIPNLITLGNLFCGVMAVRMVMPGRWTEAIGFICLGIVLDFFDGLAARLLQVPSTIGKELDSLADTVTSGVAPGFLLFMILWEHSTITFFKYIAFLIPVFAAYRLAKFNVDERQHNGLFRGLPTPANALFWVGISLWSEECDLPWAWYGLAGVDPGFWTQIFCDAGYVCLAIISLLLNILMVSNLPMFSLKVHSLAWVDNKLQYLFAAGCLLLVLLFGIAAVPMLIVWYIILSACTARNYAH